MSIPDTPSSDRGIKTIAILLEPDMHAQLSLIAQLRSSTITDEIRLALAAHVESIKSLPELAARADDVLDAIEREAVARRQAIATLFGTAPAAVQSGESELTDADTSPSRPRKGRSAPDSSS